MDAQAEGDALLLELLQLQTDKKHDELQKRLVPLAEGQESPLWDCAFERVQASILRELAREEGATDEAESLVDLFAAAVRAMVPKSPTFLLAMKYLHSLLVVLEGGSLRGRILSLCERWCLSRLPDWEDVWTNTFLHHVKLSLQAGAPKKHITTVCQLMGGLETRAVSFEDPDQKPLLELISRCAACPDYLDRDKGRQFVSYLLKQKAVVVRAVYNAVDASFPSITRRHAEVLGRLYLSAWKARTEENSEALEDGIQDVMLTAVNGDLPAEYHENLFKFLSVFHSAWADVEVAKMVFRLYQPILWRGLKVPNCVVRKSAARVFFDAFPLLEHWQVSAREKEMRERCDLIRFLLLDPTPMVRVVAVKGTMRALACYYELFPYDEKKKIMNILLKKNGHDVNSQMSRGQVLIGLGNMAKNGYTHSQLRSVLPSTKHFLYDSNNKVRAAFVSLLFTARIIRGFAFTRVVTTEELLNALPEECTPVARGIVRVLHNTYFNPGVSVVERINRCLALMERNRRAGLKFYFELVYVSPPDLILGFMLSTCNVLRRNFASEKENTSSIPCEGDEDDEEDEEEESEEEQSLLREQQVAMLLDALAVVFTSMRNRVRVKESEQHHWRWKLLHLRLKKMLRTLLKNITDAKMKVTCLYLASLMPEKCVTPTLGRQCLSLLEGIAGSGGADPDAMALDMKACLYTVCRAHKAADVLSSVSDWLGELHGQRTPKRKVRFREPTRNPGLALDILQCLLEMTQATRLLLKNHLVPAFDTWSVLLRVVGTLRERVCDPKTPRPDELLFRAFDTYLRMTLLLSNQEHPATKEKFNAPAALNCQMEWIREDLLPVIAVQSTAKRQDSVRVLQIYLKSTIDVFRVDAATHEFAESTVDFLKRCRHLDVEDLAPQLAEVAKVIDSVKILFANDVEKEASITASLASLHFNSSAESEDTPDLLCPKERRTS